MPPADPNDPQRLASSAYILRIRQHPARGKVLGKDKDRKPLDPPPVIQLFVRDPQDPAQNYLQSPYYFMAATLWHAEEDKAVENGHQAFTGTMCSSLHRLKDMDSAGQSRDGGFFVFGDLSCKIEGKYRLKMILYENLQGVVQSLAETVTHIFEVYNTKNFPGMQESTFMSRSFGDQGVRLRIRKESRQLMKRPASSYSPGTSHSSVPPGGAYPSQAAYPPMQNGYGQPGYVKNEDGLDEPASKRQRSANTSPTGYMERSQYPAMAPQAYANQAYADPNYASSLGSSMGIQDNNLMAQTQISAYPGRGSMYSDPAQAQYQYDRSSNMPIYGGPRTSEATQAAGYSTAGYQNGYPTGYPTSTGAASGMSNYYTNGNLQAGYNRPPGQP